MGRTVIHFLAGLVIFAAMSVLYLSLRGGFGPRVDARPHEASGRIMARQALAWLAPGGQITVITRDTSTFKNPASDLQLASFQKTIAQAHAKIRSLHALQVDPLRPIAVPSGDFCQVLRNTPEGSVIVSFMGLPQLTQEERSRLGDIKPEIVAFCSGNLPELADLRSLFDQGLLAAAVLDCRGAEPPLSAANSRDRAERAFLTITATNLADLSLSRGSER